MNRALEGEEELAMGRSGEKSILGRGNHTGKGPGAGACQLCSKNSGEAGEAGAD